MKIMPFQCPECNNPNSLNILNSIELPPDIRSDEISLQTVQCTRCDFRGIAIYEESRRGNLGEESFSHMGYQTDLNSFHKLAKFIKNCPSPRNKNCNCETHKKLGSTNTSGRCAGLSLFYLKTSFTME
jgi:hypothetical protein